MDSPAAAFDGRTGRVEQLNEAWSLTPELLALSGSIRLSEFEEETTRALLPIASHSEGLRDRIREAVNNGPQTLGVMISVGGVAKLHQIKFLSMSRDVRGGRHAPNPLVVAWLSMPPKSGGDGVHADMTEALARYGALIAEPWAYVDAAGIYRYVNPQALAVLGPDGAGGLVGMHFAQWALDRPGRSVGVDAIARGLKGANLSYDRLRFDHRFGEERWHRVEIHPDRDHGGKLLGVFVISHDVHEHRLAQEKARSAQNLLDLHLRHGPFVVIELDEELTIVSWSPKAEALFGCAASEAIGTTVRSLGLIPDIDDVEPGLKALLAQEGAQAWRSRNQNRTRNGDMVWVDWFDSAVRDPVSGRATILCLGVDVTQEFALKRRLGVAATHDELTGALNRKALSLFAAAKLERGSQVALVLIGIDSFKQMNDYRGHLEGDKLLVAIAQRLQGMLNPGERMARFGGDEFAVLLDLEHHASDAALFQRTNTFLQGVAEPITSEFEFSVTASAGIAKSTDADSNAELLFQNVDLALQRAKAECRGSAVIYERLLGVAARRRLAMVESLRNAVMQQKISVRYQPIFESSSDKIIGAEALARWVEDEENVEPSIFVALAEEQGFIHELWHCVMRKACLFAASINERGSPSCCPISVNVSPLQLTDRTFDQRVISILAETQCLPAWIEFEVTESAGLGDGERAHMLRKLAGLGIRCSVDDFGTGYSNFAHLKTLPLTSLKIDKSFIRDLSRGELTIVNAIVSMAHSLHLAVVAEGVEYVEELVALKAIGCDRYQGFIASKAIAAEEFASMLASDRSSRAV